MQEELKNPIVFQCIECYTVVTDSFYLMERMEDTLIFSSAPNTTEDLEINHSAEEEGSFCTYNKVLCVCGEVIGKKYVTVSRKMSSCLGNYSLDIRCVRGYQLGVHAQPKEIICMTNTEINTEIVRLQRFCTYLYSQIKGSMGLS